MSKKARNIGLFCYPNFRKVVEKMRDDIGGVLRLFRELNPHKGSFGALQRSIYRLISDFSAKNSTQSFKLGFSGFHEMWKHWNRVLFCFPENQVIENLSAICEPFLTASVTVREAAPPRAIEAAVNDLWACEWSISLGCTILFFSEALQYYHEGFLMLFR